MPSFRPRMVSSNKPTAAPVTPTVKGPIVKPEAAHAQNNLTSETSMGQGITRGSSPFTPSHVVTLLSQPLLLWTSRPVRSS